MNINDFKIMCIHLIGTEVSNERFKYTNQSFKNMGILNFVDYYKCVRSLHDDHMIEIYKTLRNGYYDSLYLTNKNVYGNVYNELRNYYYAIKKTYIEGYKYLMIFEDDIIYEKDNLYFNNMINNIPDDFDICKLTCWGNYNLRYNLTNSNNWFSIYNDNIEPGYLLGGHCWCINRSTMELLINEIDYYPQVIDELFYVLYKKYNIKIYIPNYLFLDFNKQIKSNII